jgi:hypothetical protein
LLELSTARSMGEQVNSNNFNHSHHKNNKVFKTTTTKNQEPY